MANFLRIEDEYEKSDRGVADKEKRGHRDAKDERDDEPRERGSDRRGDRERRRRYDDESDDYEHERERERPNRLELEDAR